VTLEHLYSPLWIKNVTLRDRIVATAHNTRNFVSRNFVSDPNSPRSAMAAGAATAG
jgi:hypothetical protein